MVTHLKEDLVTIQKQKPDQKVVDFLNSAQFQWTKEKNDNYNKNCQTYERKYDRDIGTFKTREFLEKPLYRLVTLEKLNEIFNNVLSFTQSRLERQEAKLKIWKAVPTYREEALARKQKKENK